MFIERFMAWSVASCADQRAEAIRRLADKFLNGRIPQSDQAEIEKALTLYLDDSSSVVRKALADCVAQHADAPRHLVWALSRDISEVSEVIYARSPALRCRDLIDAIKQGDPNVQRAIARRDELVGDTIRTLVEHAGADAVHQLLINPQVVLGPGLKHDIAERLGDDCDIRNLLLDDCDIDAATRQVLTERLSGSLVDFADNMGWGNTDRMEIVAQDARNRVTVEIAMQTAPEKMDEYLEHLLRTKQLSAAMLIRASCMGHAALFEYAIAKLSGVSLNRVQAIVDEGRIASFNSLYGRTGLPQSAYPVFVAAIEAWQEPKEMPQLIAQIIAKAEADPRVDGALLTMLGQMACEANRDAANDYERQLMLAA